MRQLSPTGKDRVPAAFHQHNQVRARRTADLTRRAIARLKAEGRKITLTAIAQATRAVDESGQGLTAKTILRNPEARELFHQQSTGYQMRQERVGKIKHRRSRPRDLANPGTEYHGLRSSDLIAIIGQLKQTIGELQVQQTKLQAERDATNQKCTALQEQNTRQLAALTTLQQQIPD